MLTPFFVLAGQSPTRQRALRRVAAAHVGLLLAVALSSRHRPGEGTALIGHLLLVAGIVEGAVLVGWRLTQLPKSQALEFLLVTPLRPRRVLLAEAAVGLTRLALVTLAGLPMLALLTNGGCLNPVDLVPLLVMPFTWGAITVASAGVSIDRFGAGRTKSLPAAGGVSGKGSSPPRSSQYVTASEYWSLRSLSQPWNSSGAV